MLRTQSVCLAHYSYHSPFLHFSVTTICIFDYCGMCKLIYHIIISHTTILSSSVFFWLQNVPPDLSICAFVLEQSLSVRALQEILASREEKAEGVSKNLYLSQKKHPDSRKSIYNFGVVAEVASPLSLPQRYIGQRIRRKPKKQFNKNGCPPPQISEWLKMSLRMFHSRPFKCQFTPGYWFSPTNVFLIQFPRIMVKCSRVWVEQQPWILTHTGSLRPHGGYVPLLGQLSSGALVVHTLVYF